MTTVARIYGPDHKLVAEVGLRHPTLAEKRETPDGTSDAARFTREVTVPENGYIVLVRDEPSP